VSCRTELAGEAHTFAESLIKPCAVTMETCGLDELSGKKTKHFSYLTAMLNVSFKICQQIYKDKFDVQVTVPRDKFL